MLRSLTSYVLGFVVFCTLQATDAVSRSLRSRPADSPPELYARRVSAPSMAEVEEDEEEELQGAGDDGSLKAPTPAFLDTANLEGDDWQPLSADSLHPPLPAAPARNSAPIVPQEKAVTASARKRSSLVLQQEVTAPAAARQQTPLIAAHTLVPAAGMRVSAAPQRPTPPERMHALGLLATNESFAQDDPQQPWPPETENAYKSCDPPCMKGRGICNDNVCFCRSPYTGSTCQKTVSALYRASLPMTLGFAICCLVLGIIMSKLVWVFTERAVETRLERYGQGRRHYEKWQPPQKKKGGDKKKQDEKKGKDEKKEPAM